jgi:hypothetical protein
MSIVKEVTDGIGIVADGIEHIRTMADAVRSGREYFINRYPEIQKHVAAMCVEMRNTAVAIAAASAILTHFRFTIAGSNVDSEPARFNDHLIAHKERAAQVSRTLHTLRGHCHVIKQHADAIEKRASSLNLSRMLILFGIDAAEADRKVSQALNDIYDEEMQGYRLAGALTGALQRALEEVARALGPAGTMDPKNVPAAAKLLGEYADAFSVLESAANFVALDLQQSIDALEGRIP